MIAADSDRADPLARDDPALAALYAAAVPGRAASVAGRGEEAFQLCGDNGIQRVSSACRGS